MKYKYFVSVNIFTVTKIYLIKVPFLHSIIFYLNAIFLKKNINLYFLILPKTEWYQIFHKNMKQQFSTLIIIRNIYSAANQPIIRFSEGSCDTEDWSNDAKNSALITAINYILLCSRIEDSYFKF